MKIFRCPTSCCKDAQLALSIIAAPCLSCSFLLESPKQASRSAGKDNGLSSSFANKLFCSSEVCKQHRISSCHVACLSLCRGHGIVYTSHISALSCYSKHTAHPATPSKCLPTLRTMSSTPATSPAGSGCSAGSGSQTTATPVSEKGIPVAAYVYGSGSVGRALGRRSLDTFRSVKESLTSRRALDTTASQTRAAPATACSASAGSSPVEAPTKQRWFASLRSRASPAAHTPVSPTSLSSTLRRARLFRSPPTQEACDLAAPPSTPTQKLPIRPHLALPRLDMSSFQAEMQRVYTPLGEGFEYTKSSRGMVIMLPRSDV